MDLSDYLVSAFIGVIVVFVFRVEEHFKDVKQRLDKIQRELVEKE